MIYLIVFLNIFIVYLWTIFPTIAAYRDSAEMCCVGKLLGIAHPPGYPLYTLLINIFWKILPLGNLAYRFNIFSAIVSALTGMLLFYLCRKIQRKSISMVTISLIDNIIIYFFVLIFAFGYLQWYLSLVSEMYTFNVLFGIVVLILAYRYFFETEKKLVYILFFIFGLGLGNRLDLILFFPIIFFVFWDYIKKSRYKIKELIFLCFVIFLGLTVYLYLPLRSSQKPLLDWNHPAELSRFWSSLTRKTHGSTLDMLSLSYRPAENFLAGIKLYFKHIIENITIFGLIIVLLGSKNLVKQNFVFFVITLLCWLISCVWFIYKANMPPNPHAMAILEAHFLLPNLIIFLWLFYGILEITKKFLSKFYIKFVLILVMVLCIMYNLKNNIYKLNKRNHFYAYDYTTNLFRSVPDDSLVLIKEDVQLFSCWYRKYIEKFRPKVYVIASGLAGAEWYVSMFQRYLSEIGATKQIFFCRLDDNLGWDKFISENKKISNKIFVTHNVEFGQLKNYKLFPVGLCSEICSLEEYPSTKHNYKILSEVLQEEIYIYRNEYLYDLDKEFFSSDIVEEYSKAHSITGDYLRNQQNFVSCIKEYKSSILMNPDFPVNYFDLGYVYFSMKNYNLAEKFYTYAVRKYENYLLLAQKYNALPDVIKNYKEQTANAYLHLGVVSERLGKLDFSVECYNSALGHNPNFADAYYNLGVVYWHKKDWEKVRYYFNQTLKINPNHSLAKFYLEKLQ